MANKLFKLIWNTASLNINAPKAKKRVLDQQQETMARLIHFTLEGSFCEQCSMPNEDFQTGPEYLIL